MSFTDFLVRDNFSDNGSIPTGGVVYQSPDIIPYQTGTLSDPSIVSTYGSNPGLPVLNNSINNVYVRAKNLSSSAQQGNVQLFYTPSSLFAQPSQWSKNTIATAGGTTVVPFVDAQNNNSPNVGPGDFAATQPPFVLTNLQSPPAGAHYCFIAITSLAGQTVAPPANFTSNSAFVNWVETNPNVAWNNFVFAQPSSPTVVQSLQFANANNTSAQMIFEIQATNCPTNTAVLFQCTDPACPIDVTVYLPQPDSEGNQTTSTTQTVPANYSGTILVQGTAPSGKQFGVSGWSFCPTYLQIVSDGSTDELERKYAVKRTLAVTRPDGSVVQQTLSVMQIGQVNVLPES
jgi:hypothetical protein